jgi:hypothetical protein
MKTITSFTTLMMYAKQLGDARKSGDVERIKQAQKEHDEYRDMCLESDEMIIGVSQREL